MSLRVSERHLRRSMRGRTQFDALAGDRREGESEYIAMLSPKTRDPYREFMARRHDPDQELKD